MEFRLDLDEDEGIPSLSLWTLLGEQTLKVAEGKPLLIIDAFPRRFPFKDSLEVNTSFHIEGEGCFWIKHRLRARYPLFLSGCLASIVMQDGPRNGVYRFLPHLHPESGMVAADHCFRSPCIVIEGSHVSLALVPDLEELSCLQRQGIRTAMTLEGERLTYGILNHRVKGHVFFVGRSFPGFFLGKGEEAALSYYILAERTNGEELHRRVNSFLWERYGRAGLSKLDPQRLPLIEHAELAAEWALLNPENWVEMDLGGRRCGGIFSYNMNCRRPPLRSGKYTTEVFLRYPRLYPGILQLGAAHLTTKPVVYRMLRGLLSRFPVILPAVVQMQSWFNCLRTAYGVYWLALEEGKDELMDRALMVKELALAAPREKGLIPAVLYMVGDKPVWVKGTKGFLHLDWYHLADTCVTGYHLLEWYRDHHSQPAIIDTCCALADTLLKVQGPRGSFPAWIRWASGEFVVDPTLEESAESAPAVMFLALLSEIAGRGDYLKAASAGGEFLSSHVVEPQTWWDYENFFSCSPKTIDWKDPRSRCLPECTLGMYWTAAAFLQLFLASKDKAWLEFGRRALNRLLSYQQVWSPPSLSINVYGGFASQNTDGEWNDARQGLVAPLLFDYYEALGEMELLERGVAALRSCFATMHLDREPFAPLRPSVRGAISENYGHFGYDAPAPGYLEPDWGAGSALYALARVLPSYGQVYMDLERGHAVGIDACSIESLSWEGDRVRFHITSHLNGPRRLRAVFRIREEGLRVELNGRILGYFPSGELREGIYVDL